MPSTTVHFPDNMLKKIDEMLKREKISRNKFIIQACEEALKNSAGTWPDDFFKCTLGKNDLKLLRDGAREMETAIISHRKNRASVEL